MKTTVQIHRIFDNNSPQSGDCLMSMYRCLITELF